MKFIGTFLKKLFIGKAENTFYEFCRSIIVGGVAFIVDALLLILLKELGGASTLISATLSFIVSVIVNYTLANLWAYRSSNIDNGAVRLALFVIISAIGLVMNDAIVVYFDKNVTIGGFIGKLLPAYLIGKIVATVIIFFWNFTARKLLLFRGKKTPKEEQN